MQETEYWVCRFCNEEAICEGDDHVPKSWTFTQEYGLICGKCSNDKGVTYDGEWEEISFNPSTVPIRYLKIHTVSSPSWVAWTEAEVFADAPLPVADVTWGMVKERFHLP